MSIIRRSIGVNKYTANQCRVLNKIKNNKELYSKLCMYFEASNNCEYISRVLDIKGNVVDQGVRALKKK